jgi:hypothetical protein
MTYEEWLKNLKDPEFQKAANDYLQETGMSYKLLDKLSDEDYANIVGPAVTAKYDFYKAKQMSLTDTGKGLMVPATLTPVSKPLQAAPRQPNPALKLLPQLNAADSTYNLLK